MNKTFKVVFNRARGVLMVANEITSSVQKKGTKTVVAASCALLSTVAVAAPNDVAFNGQDGMVDSANQAEAVGNKVIGGWDVFESNGYDGDTSVKTQMTVDAEYALDEIIGGNAVKQTKDSNDYSIASTSTTVKNTTGVHAVVGGSKGNNATGQFNIENVALDIQGGVLGVTDGNQNGMVVGGSYLKATANAGGGYGGVASSHIKSSTLTVNGGEFKSTIIGGSAAEIYETGTQEAKMSVSTDSVTTLITGGEFNSTIGAAVIGGSYASGVGAEASVTNAKTTIQGGQDFKGVFNGNIHGGSYADNGGVASTQNTVLELNGNSSDDRLNLKDNPSKAIYAGGFNSTISGSLELRISNVDMNYQSGASKWGVYGGSKVNQAGDYSEGDSQVFVSNSILNADVRGGAGVFGSDVNFIGGNTSVTVADSQISGYDDKGSTWPGRVFGNGIVQDVSNANLYYGNSVVNINDNVYGITVDKTTGDISYNPGTRVYGAGQLFAAKNSKLVTEKTVVTVTGEHTQLQEIIGGGIISGTLAKDKLSTMVTGETKVTVNSGLISDYVVGGNNSNLFGYSVIGLEAENGFEFNGTTYANGSSNVVINGGDLSSALVIGGSLADWGSYDMNAGKTESTSERVAIVVGKSSVEINGGTVDTAVGGGVALISVPTNYAEGSNSPDSLVYGETTVTVTGGEMGTLIGAGFAQANMDTMDPDATVHGSVSINISGGTVDKVIGGGFVDGAGTADVTENVIINLSGGKVNQIIAGGVVNGVGTASVQGNSTVVFEKNFGFDGEAIGSGANHSILQFGTAESPYSGDFLGTFSEFDELNVTKGSTLILATLTSENVGSSLQLNGGGGLVVDSLTHTNGELALTAGSLEVKTIAMKENGSLIVNGGNLLTTSDQMFKTSLVTGEEDNADGVLSNGVAIESGKLSLQDAKYNLAYAESVGTFLTNATVVMLGDLVNKEDIKNGATVDELAPVGPNVILDKVTVNAKDKDLQIGGNPSADANVSHREESLGVSGIDLGTADTVTVTEGKTLTLTGNAGSFVTSDKDVTVNATEGGTLALGGEGSQGGELNATVNVDDRSKVVVTGAENIAIANIKGEGTVLVGNNETAGNLTINSLKGMTGLIVFDPDWTEGTNTVHAASKGAINGLNIDALTAKIGVARNTIVATDATSDEAISAFETIALAQGLSWKDDVTAALYAGSQIKLDATGGILVDGSQTNDTITANPDLVIGGAVTVAQNGMFIVNQANAGEAVVDGKVTLNDGSYLGVINASEGQFNLATGEVVADGASVVTDNPFIDGAIDGSTVTTTLNEEAGLGSLASTGIQAMTRHADFIMAETIADRTSIDQELNPGMNLWANVTGERYESTSMDNGGTFKSDMGYGAFGAEVPVTDTVTAGAAIQYGKGSLRSGVASIKNNIDNYGFTAYATKSFGAAKVVGELAYLQSKNDITSSQAAMNQEVDAKIYSAGIRAQYQLTTDHFQFVPSIGIRVSQLETDAMDVGAVKVKEQEQTLVQVPIALRINGFEQSAADGWTLAPSFKVAFVPTFGDEEISVLSHDQDVIDTTPVSADFGLRAKKGNMMVDANFMVGGGKDGTSSVGGKIGMKYVF